MSNYLEPVAAVLIPNLGGFVGAYFTRGVVRPKDPDEKTWYQLLNKPSWNPPRWVFGPVWTGLYCSMGYASYMVWRDGDGFSGKAALPLACYGAQLALNWAWSPIFFRFKKLGLASAENCALWGSIVATIVTFHDVSPTAAHIMLPYLAWVSFANVLTFWIWRNNKDRTD